MTDEQRRALILEKAGADFALKRNGKVIRSRKTYNTREEWEDHLAEQKRRLELRLKSAGTESERADIRRELRVNEIMSQYTDVERR